MVEYFKNTRQHYHTENSNDHHHSPETQSDHPVDENPSSSFNTDSTPPGDDDFRCWRRRWTKNKIRWWQPVSWRSSETYCRRGNIKNHDLPNDEGICHEDQSHHYLDNENSQEHCKTTRILLSEDVDLKQCEQLLPDREGYEYSLSNFLQHIHFLSARRGKYLRNQLVLGRTAFNPHSVPVVQSLIDRQHSWNDHPVFLFVFFRCSV